MYSKNKILIIFHLFAISKVFGECPCNIRYGIVTCDRSFITHMPGDFFEFCPDIVNDPLAIKSLDLQQQHMVELLPDAFADFPNLNGIALSFNSLEIIHYGAFNGLDLLTTLLLDHNNISNVPDGLFDSLINLKTLDLSHNLIQNMTTK